jgi:hypothetical protein
MAAPEQDEESVPKNFSVSIFLLPINFPWKNCIS